MLSSEYKEFTEKVKMDFEKLYSEHSIWLSTWRLNVLGDTLRVKDKAIVFQLLIQ